MVTSRSPPGARELPFARSEKYAVFDGRALDPLADDQAHREHVRHLSDDGLQANAIRVQEMAAAERLTATARSDRRNSIDRRNQTPSNRRLKLLATTSCAQFAFGCPCLAGASA